MIGGGLFEELKLGIALLPFTQSYEEVLADFGYVLGRVLDDCDLGLGDLLWLYGGESIRLGLLDLLEHSL